VTVTAHFVQETTGGCFDFVDVNLLDDDLILVKIVERLPVAMSPAHVVVPVGPYSVVDFHLSKTIVVEIVFVQILARAILLATTVVLVVLILT
jgi:hypothetical protein